MYTVIPNPVIPNPLMRARLFPVVLAIAVASLACGSAETGHSDSKFRGEREMAETHAKAKDAGTFGAVAEILPSNGNSVRGTIRFQEAAGLYEVVLMTAEIEGLPAGKHGFHVHEYGDCSAPDASSAGAHFAFEGIDGRPSEITGDLGELESSGEGKTQQTAQLARVSLQGPRSIVGRSVVIHARGNDHSSPPDGNAGARIACGVIERIQRTQS